MLKVYNSINSVRNTLDRISSSATQVDTLIGKEADDRPFVTYRNTITGCRAKSHHQLIHDIAGCPGLCYLPNALTLEHIEIGP